MASALQELPWTWPSGEGAASPAYTPPGLSKSRLTWLRPWKGIGRGALHSRARLRIDALPG
eukprot:11239473-Alexandrium_andersonii.AAC.1